MCFTPRPCTEIWRVLIGGAHSRLARVGGERERGSEYILNFIPFPNWWGLWLAWRRKGVVGPTWNGGNWDGEK